MQLVYSKLASNYTLAFICLFRYELLNDIILFMSMYADNALVFFRSKENLQYIFNDIELYCAIWGLKTSTGKTKAMMFEKVTTQHVTYSLIMLNLKLPIPSNN